MELIQFSFNNRFYIFYDRILEKLLVYELCIFEQEEDSDLYKETHHDNDNFSCHQSYEFMLKYELKTGNCYLFKFLTLNDVDGVDYFRKYPGQIKINNKSNVKMLYNENVNTNEAYSDNGYETMDLQQ